MHKIRLCITAAVSITAAFVYSTPAIAADFHRNPLRVTEENKFTVSLTGYPLHNPSPRDWYHSVANVVSAPDGSLVAAYRLSDNHLALQTYIVVARSEDGGKTWGGHRSIASANVWQDQRAWVAPQMSVLKDGRIVIICDLGHRDPGDNWPMLVQWQKPGRGMWNYLIWSHDSGKTWSEPQKVDDVGGEPGYIFEMSDGTLGYTRTSSTVTDKLKNPPMPWGNNYYRNEVVLSRDGGRTWPETHWLADSPWHGDCEVGVMELSPGCLIAATRIGLGNGEFGHPSRLIFSDDGGKTWPRDTPAPFYGQRVHLGKLQSGKLLATFRNRWGTPGNRALVFDPKEDLGFQPTSFIVDEARCELSRDALTIRTGEGQHEAVEFSFYPAQDNNARVEIETRLRVDAAEKHGVAISAGVWLRFMPDQVSLADRPSASFALNTREWHTYHIVRENGRVSVFVDGREMMREPIDDIWVREVRFGNRGVAREGDLYSANRGRSHWSRFNVVVKNPDDYSIDWRWDPSKGYPDQFRRDRVVVLDNAFFADTGYSSWTQQLDGRIVIMDYTTGELRSFGHAGEDKAKSPFIRAYLVTEADLVRR